MRLQCLESAVPQNTAAAVDLRRRVDDRALDKEEEDYFNEERFCLWIDHFIFNCSALTFLTHFNTDSDEEDSASASNTQKEKPASNAKKEQTKPPHISNGVAASPASSR